MASVRDILVFSVILFCVGLTVMISVYLSHSISLSIINTTTIGNNSKALQVMQNGNAAVNMEDYVYLGLFIGLLLFIIVSAWFVTDYPIFAPVYFFALVFIVFISYVLQMSWISFSMNSIIASTSSSLPITNFILTYLCYFTSVAGLIGLAIIYAKPKGDNNL